MYELEVAAEQGIAHGNVGERECAFREEVVNVGRCHTLGKGFQVSRQDVLEERRWRGCEAGGCPVAVDGGGFQEGVSRINLEMWRDEVLALGNLALADLLVNILV